MPDLFPTFELPSEIGAGTSEPIGYQPSIYFDFEKGDFAASNRGALSVASSGKEAWIQWCLKNCRTQKGAALCYGGDYGVDYESILQETDFGRICALLERDITSALLADRYRRTTLVNNFSFARDVEGIRIQFDVHGMNGEIESIRFKV